MVFLTVYCRWAIYSELLSSLCRVQAAVTSGVPASEAAAAVAPTEVREFMAYSTVGEAAAAVIDSSGAYLTLQQGRQWPGESPGSSSARSTYGSAVPVSRFVDYGSAASQLPRSLLRVVKKLLQGPNPA